MFDIKDVSVIYTSKYDIRSIEHILGQYREIGIRYRVWDFIQNRGLNESYTYFINNQKIHEIGSFVDLDLVIWVIPKYVGNYKFIYQYVLSQWQGPIIFILDIEGGIHNYEWINQSCVLSDDISANLRVSNWGSSWKNSNNSSPNTSYKRTNDSLFIVIGRLSYFEK